MVESAYDAVFKWFAAAGVGILTPAGFFLGLFMPPAIIGIIAVILTLIGTRMIAPLVGPARYEGPYRGMFIAAIVLISLNLSYLCFACLPIGAGASAVYRALCNTARTYTILGGGITIQEWEKLLCDLAAAWEVLLAGTMMTIALHITQLVVISATPTWCDPGCADCCCNCCACCQDKAATV